MNSTIEDGQNNSQGPSIIGNRDPYLDGSDENRVNHELRPQRASFRRSVSEGPQVPILKVFKVHPDASIPEVVRVLKSSSMVILNQVSQPYQRRTNSRSRHHQLYYLTHKVQGLIPTERKTRPKKPIDYAEGQLPPGLTYEDLFKRCSTPPSKRRRVGDTKSSPIFIFSSSGAEPHIQDVNTNNPFNEDEEYVHYDGLQDELPHESDSMSMIDGASSHTLLELNSDPEKAPRSGSQSDNVTNELPQTYKVPSPEEQSFPELNEEPNANVGSRPNSGGELHVVSQPQNFSSDTHLITVAENFGLFVLAASRQGVDGVNNETLANGEVLNSVENRSRSSYIKDSQLDETSKRIEPHPQNHSPVHELNRENVKPKLISSQQLFDYLNQIDQQSTHRFNAETNSYSCLLNNPASGIPQPLNYPHPIDPPQTVNTPQPVDLPHFFSLPQPVNIPQLFNFPQPVVPQASNFPQPVVPQASNFPQPVNIPQVFNLPQPVIPHVFNLPQPVNIPQASNFPQPVVLQFFYLPQPVYNPQVFNQP
ncbi:hypothetical protein CLIB1444_12S01288 [[Candida] jaroonii]|uniref:Uncharacterized protein n=1 Tax=[Candida] jaroonii TaxID=467808 RepID=A0ACA9YEU6_9ASCO|nr:hypothetical protein CLIB1444_12S01288 [[Candida] jaroonii]